MKRKFELSWIFTFQYKLAGCLFVRLVCFLFGQSFVCFIGYFIVCLVGWLLVCSVICLVSALMCIHSHLEMTKSNRLTGFVWVDDSPSIFRNVMSKLQGNITSWRFHYYGQLIIRNFNKVFVHRLLYSKICITLPLSTTPHRPSNNNPFLVSGVQYIILSYRWRLGRGHVVVWSQERPAHVPAVRLQTTEFMLKICPRSNFGGLSLPKQ